MSKHDYENKTDEIRRSLQMMMGLLGIVFLLMFTLIYFFIFGVPSSKSDETQEVKKPYIQPDSNFVHLWNAPADWRMMKLEPEEQEKVKYGRELIAHTADFLGPNGSVKHISNGMNCQNFHLKAGMQPWE